MQLSREEVRAFRHELARQAQLVGRPHLPWRQAETDGQFDPYKILLSEVMLQQTQVDRVIPKYHQFLACFPTVTALASARLSDALIAWQGLGYNRRAKFLWQTAQMIEAKHSGTVPSSVEALMQLPGIGANTAGAIVTYAFNQPALFIETNVRTVYFHHFFHSQTDIADRDILLLLEQTIDRRQPRQFYWNVMDYGTALKGQGLGRVSASRHYAKQSTFAGSNRQLRGRVLRLLAKRAWLGADLIQELADARATDVLAQLESEAMIIRRNDRYHLA